MKPEMKQATTCSKLENMLYNDILHSRSEWCVVLR